MLVPPDNWFSGLQYQALQHLSLSLAETIPPYNLALMFLRQVKLFT